MSEPASPRPLAHPDEVLTLIEGFSCAQETETVELSQAAGRALAADLPALLDQPPFDKSAMDGFAYGEPAGDLWRVVERLPAGQGPGRMLGPGECARIMTGAPLPPGARAVQRLEWAVESAGPAGATLVRFARQEPTDNVIRRGENQVAGRPLLDKRSLQPQDVGILASSGYDRVAVVRRPVVGILSSGDELQPAGGAGLRPFAIFDSNGPLLCAAASASGCRVRDYGIVGDEPAALARAVASALDECDVLLASGGVSVGDLDYMPRAFESAGVERLVHGVAMRPGKPLFYGLKGSQAVFGLPGNPVSVFVAFEVLVRPHLFRRLGLHWRPRLVTARLGSPLRRRGTDRVDFVPARLDPTGDEVHALPYGGSSSLSVLAATDCLLRMEIGEREIEAGATVRARLVRAAAPDRGGEAR